ncbi:MAG: ATP-binding cassette domain-containing protein [Leptolyngbyaceae cyanobacterium bins.59]|nr:ATP-binding cassette domain-containing protein [Leptolyngbyaceae cyanobacterium bins.59]
MAKVVLENVYKSFAWRRGESTEPVSQDLAGLEPDPAGGIPPLKSRNGKGKVSPTTSVLRRINLSIQDGEFMVLVGPSGCGKSTLLRLIAGLEELTAGQIWVGDRLVNELPPKERDIAMVFQNYALYPHMSVYDNLAFGLRRTKLKHVGSKAEDAALPLSVKAENWLSSVTRPLPKQFRYWSDQERAVDEWVQKIAQMLQIEMLLERLPRQLSGGQKQRVALGRAMARQPQVFLMDEPLSNLDAKLRSETRAQIVNLQHQLQTTTIYVTHDQTEAMTMGDRIAVMNAGQIQQLAAPIELYNRPANRFVAEFIGSPPMNFLTVQVETPVLLVHPQFQLALPDSWATLLRPYEGRSLTLGIRPEHLRVADTPEEALLRVQVERVEALGSETYLAINWLGQQAGLTSPLQVRVSPDRLIRLGDGINLSIAIDKLHLFDRDTGLAVRSE